MATAAQDAPNHTSTAAVGTETTAPAAPQAAAHKYVQASIHTNHSDYVRLYGFNQHHKRVWSPWIPTPNAWTRLPNWWWQMDGPITIHYTGKYKGKNYSGSHWAWFKRGTTPAWGDLRTW
ncbi:hypothetical protein ACFWPU_36540 [Streptomyces sp. NPDC058471]|uniref:hypothetical protein n=1 Tax=Streptomyces sp. NPDC058471 TaxID=3346516 RepID=UPI00365B3068